jgi:putative acetyltransferase
LTVREERESDRDAADAIHRRAFGRDLEAAIAARIRASDRFVPPLSLVAVDDDGTLVGHVLVSYVDLERSTQRLLQLGPIAVEPARQRRGIGDMLVRAALARAKELNAPLVLVEGSPEYYGRFGFTRADELGLLPPEGAPAWAFQVAVLDRRRRLPRGRIVYPPAFQV